MGDRITKLQGASTRPGVYKCKDCRKPFSVTVGTVMERSHIPLTKWIAATYFMMAGKKSMSAKNLQRLIDTSYEAAWFLFHRLRECPVNPDQGPLGGEGKTVEADEVYIGGKEKNKHMNKRTRHGYRVAGGVGKEAVLALVEREGHVRSFHLASVNSHNVRNVLTANVDRKSRLATDEAQFYKRVGREFAGHDTVHHSEGEYVRGEAYTNTIEGYFALLRRGIYGQFHSVSEAHLHRYLAEFDFRYNHRDLSSGELADELLRGAKGKRLMYRQPDQTPDA
jgi:hypothetical protein